MSVMSCHGARRRLSAFHDGELPTREQVEVEAHLRTCAGCAREAAGRNGLGDELRTRAARMAVAFEGEMDGLQSGIVSRLRVEREESVPAQVGRMFEDMRLGFAALGSTAASFVSLLAVVGILNFGPQSERPDSLAGVMQGMGGSAATVDVRDLVGQQIGVPSPQDREAMSAKTIVGPLASASETQMSEEDTVFALAAVVTRQGRIASLEVVRSDQQGSRDREQILRLLDQVSRARLEPATVGGAPVAARRVWVMAHTTVRAKLPPLPKQSALPPAWTVLSVVS
jgi:anti-sigma factor RsiW